MYREGEVCKANQASTHAVECSVETKRVTHLWITPFTWLSPPLQVLALDGVKGWLEAEDGRELWCVGILWFWVWARPWVWEVTEEEFGGERSGRAAKMHDKSGQPDRSFCVLQVARGPRAERMNEPCRWPDAK